MNLGDRKAYALQATFQNAVRMEAPTAPADQLRDIKQSVQHFVESAFDEQSPQTGLDQFLTESVRAIEKAVQALYHKQGVPRATSLVLDAMLQRVQEVCCANCFNGRICGGNETDDEIVEQGGQCIREIKQAFADATQLTLAAYSSHTTLRANLELKTTGLSTCSPEIPGHKLAVNAETSFEDRPEKKVSRIDMHIAPLHLGRECLAALPYLLMHEVFCHGFQMLLHPEKRPNKGIIPDPVSEGMMDKLTVEVLKDRATKMSKSKSPDREIEMAKRNFAAALSIHMDRASLDRSPPFPEASEVKLGKDVLERVEALYAQDPPEHLAREDARALAYALNLAGWGYVARFEGLSRLQEGLRCPRDTTLIKELLNFRRSRNPVLLIHHLKISRQLSIE